MSLDLHTDPAVQAAEEITQLILAADQSDERPWTLRPTSVSKDYLPQSELATIGADLKVTVMPGLDGDEEPAGRSAVKLTFSIAVAVEQKPTEFTTASLDALCGFTEDLTAYLRRINLPCGAKHTGIAKAVPRYSWRHLKQTRSFVAIRRLYFEITITASRH